MTFVLFVHDVPAALDGRSQEEQQAVYDEYRSFAETPGIVGYRLQPSATATALRAGGGTPSARPGPLADTSETLAGFYLLATDDLDRALEVAARIPALRLGGAVEVRPLMGE